MRFLLIAFIVTAYIAVVSAEKRTIWIGCQKKSDPCTLSWKGHGVHPSYECGKSMIDYGVDSYKYDQSTGYWQFIYDSTKGQTKTLCQAMDYCCKHGNTDVHDKNPNSAACMIAQNYGSGFC